MPFSKLSKLPILLSILLAAFGTCHGQTTIVELQTKTVDASDAGSDASVDVEIVNRNFDACVINNLDSAENDFQRDEVNVFWGYDLQACENFFLPDDTIPLLTLTHSGSDAWQPEWIRVLLNDSSYIMCYDGQVLDDDESHEINDCARLLFNEGETSTVVEVQAKTADADNAGMDGSVDMELINEEFGACVINNLDSSENDFQRNRVDVFWETDLQACYLFPVPDDEIPRLTLTHSGIDGWLPEWIRILLSDSTYLMCYDGEFMDDDESHYLNCTRYAGQ